MFLRHFIDLGLYKSSCVLFSCLFFVSCNTVSTKPTGFASTAGSRKIASAAMASMHSNAFLMMQDCPVIASIQSRISSGGLTSSDVMDMMEEKDSQGKSLTQRLMSELSSSVGCVSRVAALKQDLCSNSAYADICEDLDQLAETSSDSLKEKFKSFVGGNLDSLDSKQLSDKLEEFVDSQENKDTVFYKVLAGISDKVKGHPEILSIAGLLVIAMFGKKMVAMIVGTGLAAAVVSFKLAAVASVLAVSAWFIFRTK